MSFFIACVLIYHLKMSWWWYVVAALIESSETAAYNQWGREAQRVILNGIEGLYLRLRPGAEPESEWDDD